jgi:hypothetical protein
MRNVVFEMRDWGALTNSECELWNELARNAERDVLSSDLEAKTQNSELITQNSAKPVTQNSKLPSTETWRLACGLY